MPKGIYVRVHEPTKTAIKLLVGELQSKKAETVYENEALWMLIKNHRPDIAERAEKEAKQRSASHDPAT